MNSTGMLGTTKFGNNLEDKTFNYILEDPERWGVMRNLAYASIRDDVEKIVKQTNENSADVYINAENLIQNLKSHKINQYIEGENVVQNIDLTDKNQLNQILMNSNIYQTINYVTRNNVVNKLVSHIKSDLGSFFNNHFAVITCFRNTILLLNYEINNYAFDTTVSMKEFVNSLVMTRYKGAVFSVDNSEKIKYSGRIIKFPVDFTTKRSTSFSDINYLIFYINDITVGGNIFDQDYDDLIIVLNLNNLNLKQQKTTEINGNILGETFKSYDKLNLSAGNAFTAFDYGKINALMLNTNRFSPNNKLFN